MLIFYLASLLLCEISVGSDAARHSFQPLAPQLSATRVSPNPLIRDAALSRRILSPRSSARKPESLLPDELGNSISANSTMVLSSSGATKSDVKPKDVVEAVLVVVESGESESLSSSRSSIFAENLTVLHFSYREIPLSWLLSFRRSAPKTLCFFRAGFF